MKKHAVVRKLGVVLVAAALAMSVGTTGAGEITGNGKSLQIAPHTLHGNSACAFSGRQDDPSTAEAEGLKGVLTQSWGQFVKSMRDFLTSIGVSPGNSCNPTRAAGEP